VRAQLVANWVCGWALAVSSVADAQEATPDERAETASPLPRDARAVELALDGSYAAAGSSDLDLGGGAALRAGYAFPFKWAALVPEGGIDVFGLSGVDHAVVYGAFVGGRARFGRGLEPGISAHYGVSGVSWRESYAAPTADVGLFLELTYIRRLIIGAQGEYKSTFSTGGHPSVGWYTAGLTVGTRL
jgi:hypothetical protein